MKLAVGVGENADVDEWDELCAEAGLEFVQVGGSEDRLQQFGGTSLFHIPIYLITKRRIRFANRKSQRKLAFLA